MVTPCSIAISPAWSRCAGAIRTKQRLKAAPGDAGRGDHQYRMVADAAGPGWKRGRPLTQAVALDPRASALEPA
jgi:hypothetical protein